MNQETESERRQRERAENQAVLDTGGPAFPRADGGYSTTHTGMTLLDHFAGLVVQALVSRQSEGFASTLKDTSAKTGKTVTDILAELSYRQAQAMLEARKELMEGARQP